MSDGSSRSENLDQMYHRNFLALVCDWSIYGLGMSFVSMVTILPAFVSNLSSSSVAIGLIMSIATLGFNLPQILVSRKVESLSRKKPYMMKITLGERIPWFILAILVLSPASTDPFLLLVAFFVTYATVNTAGGLTAPAWFEIVAKGIPKDRRGIYFGVANFVSSILGIVGGLVAGHFIQNLPFPLGYSACFASAFVMTMISYAALSMVQEPESIVAKSKDSSLTNFMQVTNIVKNDANFRLYLLASVISSLGGMASAFFMVNAMKVSNMGQEGIGLFTAAYSATQILSNLLWGYIANLSGHRSAVLIGWILALLASLMAIFSTDIVGFLIVFILAGAAISAYMVSGLVIVMDFAPSEQRPTYFGIANAIRAPFAALAPILGGIIADARGYLPVFAVAGFANFVSVALMLRVKEPRTHRDQDEFSVDNERQRKG